MSGKRIVIVVSDENDIHANIVLQRLKQVGDAEGVLFDSAAFPDTAALGMKFGGHGRRLFLHLPGRCQEINASDVVGVWWRRPRKHTTRFSLENLDVLTYCERNSQSLFEAWLLGCSAKIVNEPYMQARADRKPIQLQIALYAGLSIPATLITNDPDSVCQFVEEHQGKVVCKSLAGTDHHYSFTTLWDNANSKHVETLRLAPAIFQEFIDGIDVRVTIVGQEVFPAQIVPKHPGADVDWRLDPEQDICAVNLPHQIVEGLLRMMRLLSIDYGAVDMRLDKNGRYWFFEVNTSGQFLFVECKTNQPISRALAQLLSWGATNPH